MAKAKSLMDELRAVPFVKRRKVNWLEKLSPEIQQELREFAEELKAGTWDDKASELQLWEWWDKRLGGLPVGRSGFFRVLRNR